MTDYLKTIAVTVEESERGLFHWLLIESIDDPTGFTVLFGSAEVFGTWEDALDGGVATLKSLVADRTIGPRLGPTAFLPWANRDVALPSQATISSWVFAAHRLVPVIRHGHHSTSGVPGRLVAMNLPRTPRSLNPGESPS